MIPSLLAPPVVTVEAVPGDWESPLLPEEASTLLSSAPHRRAQFAAGRACARRALRELGLFQEVPIPVGPGSEPIWPEGVVGSITHCDGYCAVAVASSHLVAGLGIDAEVRMHIDERTALMVATETERILWPALVGAEWAALVFSAKESIYKLWYPITHLWLEHQDVELQPIAVGHKFRVVFRTSVPRSASALASGIRGRFALTADHIFTTVRV